MAQIQDPSNGNILRINDYKAARVTLLPQPVLNYASFSLQSGALTGVAANAPVLSLRNGGANLLAVRKVGIGASISTGFTAAQVLDFGLFVARSFTASDSAGTQATITGNNNKHRTAHQTLSAAIDLRISAAAALTAGARTLDTQPICSLGGFAVATFLGVLIYKQPDNLLKHDEGDYPIILAPNEGLILVPLTAMGAGGIIKLYADLQITELDATKFEIV